MKTTGSSAKKSPRMETAPPLPPPSIEESFLVVPEAMLPQRLRRTASTTTGKISTIHFSGDGTIKISGGDLAKRFFDWCENKHGLNEPCKEKVKVGRGKKRSAAQVEASRHTWRVHSALLKVRNPDLIVNGKC